MRFINFLFRGGETIAATPTHAAEPTDLQRYEDIWAEWLDMLAHEQMAIFERDVQNVVWIEDLDTDAAIERYEEDRKAWAS